MLEAFEEGEPTRIVRPETGPAKSGQLNEAKASALYLEVSARAAQKTPSQTWGALLSFRYRIWAASSQLLDVTAFPEAQLKSWGKTREEESGAKPREGLRRRCCRRHGFSKTKLGHIARCGSSQGETGHGQRELPRVVHLGEKPNGGPQGRS